MLRRPVHTLFLAVALNGCVTVQTDDLARGGILRVGIYEGSPTSYVKARRGAVPAGVGYALGQRLSRELGVRFAPIIFHSNDDLIRAMRQGELDITFTNRSEERTRYLGFSSSLLDLEKGALVDEHSLLRTLEQGLCAGMRIGVSKGSSSARELIAQFPDLTIVPVNDLEAAIEMLRAGELDLFATNKAILYQLSDRLPGSRVLEGRWGEEHLAAAVPLARRGALDRVEVFLEKARSEGFLSRAIRRARLRGVLTESAGGSVTADDRHCSNR